MIIKKPYAFLIKNFRVIHGLLFAMLLYLTFKLFSIYSFFSEYVSNHYYINTGTLESEYFNFLMFIVAGLVILVSIIIFYLLSIKRKENKIYILTVMYNIIIIIYSFVMFNVFQDLNINSLNTETVRFYRDISVIALIPETIFMLIMLGRTLGFNIKQFDFKKDLEEINIDSSDNEEVELSFGNDTYKFKRYLRKLFRLSKYFILENRLFVICASSAIVLILCVTLFMNITVYGVNYEENTQIVANTVWYKVNSSYLSTTDINNKVINKGKTYLIVKVLAENRLSKTYTLSRETFRLEFDNEVLFPIFTLSNSFIDFGEVFVPRELKAKENKEFVVVFELDTKKISSSSFIFKIKNYNEKAFGDIQAPYKDIILKPRIINNIKIEGEYNIPASIDFKKTILNNSKLEISEYSTSDTYSETYEQCNNEICKNIKYIVTPNNIGKGELTVLKLNTTLHLDDNLYLKKFISIPSEFLEKYAYLEYNYLGTKYISYLEAIPVKYNKDKYSYLQVTKNIKYSDNIKLIILIRGIKYTINLK